MKGGLTIHSMVKNEPFIYYSIKSVYPYVDKIIITDTGSTDHTLSDIDRLLSEDFEKKITFNTYLIPADGHDWTIKDFGKFKRQYAKEVPLGPVRQTQIDLTKTDFFMILDGDEVHYNDAMETINALDFLPHINHYQVPLVWLYSLTHSFISYNITGRLFRTAKTKMKDVYWPEMHERLDNNELSTSPFKPQDPDVSFLNIRPYIHFEAMIRPHRRMGVIDIKKLKPFTDPFPEVILKDSFYLDRFFAEKNNDPQ
ncbi:hypothetical protein LCGC14_1959370 [marine sediment metagenome]|uniref:Glycosyltransferase 2-like domain-containing protein n=1 Tax=marine sediment metagenome TaxID=412755 RepID=A0A0F9HTE5_9ZZZZ